MQHRNWKKALSLLYTVVTVSLRSPIVDLDTILRNNRRLCPWNNFTANTRLFIDLFSNRSIEEYSCHLPSLHVRHRPGDVAYDICIATEGIHNRLDRRNIRRADVARGPISVLSRVDGMKDGGVLAIVVV